MSQPVTELPIHQCPKCGREVLGDKGTCYWCAENKENNVSR